MNDSENVIQADKTLLKEVTLKRIQSDIEFVKENPNEFARLWVNSTRYIPFLFGRVNLLDAYLKKINEIVFSSESNESKLEKIRVFLCKWDHMKRRRIISNKGK